MLRPSGSVPPQYRQLPDATIERWPVAESAGCGATMGATGAAGAAEGDAAGADLGAGFGRGGAGCSGTPNVGRSDIAACAGASGGAPAGMAAVPPLPGRRSTGGSTDLAPSGAIEIIVVE